MTVFKRGDAWAAKVWRNGKWHWVGTYPTRGEAKAAEAKAKPKRASASMTVGEFADLWLAEYKRPAPSTQRSYAYAINTLKKEFGKRRLDAITKPEARAYVNRTSQTTGRVARTMFGDAMRDGLLEHNPFAGLRLQQPKGRKNLKVVDEAGIDAIAAQAHETFEEDFAPTMSALVTVAGYCGPRPGELFALEWGDVRHDELLIERSVDTTGNVKAPKNGQARMIVLPPKAREALRLIPRRPGNPLVFVTPNGRRFDKGSLRYWWAQLRTAAGHPSMAFYELRHACATLLLARGLSPHQVAVQLGHTDGGRLVQTLYGHPEEAAAREAIKAAFNDNVTELREVRNG